MTMLHSILADANSSYWLPVRASTQAPDVDNLFNFVLWVCVFFSVLILALMVLFVIRFRHRPGVTRDVSGGHNNTLEITWTVIPTIIVIAIYYWGFKGFLHYVVEPPAAYEITAIGRMWNWSFQYPNGYISPELHVPPHTPVRVVLRSEDVIHSLFVPSFRIKKDVVPGRYNRLWFNATTPGNYDVYCAAYCGTNHSTMLSRAVVHNDMADFKAWLTKNSDWRLTKSPIQAGEMFYNQRGCAQCHSINGTIITGPSWRDMFGSTVPLADGTSVLADENYVRESILEPAAKIHRGFPNVMPSFKGALKDEDIDAIIWFMKSISKNYKGDLSAGNVQPEEKTQPMPDRQAPIPPDLKLKGPVK